MGATEEFRKRQGERTEPGCPPFVPDPVVERALAAAVEAAHQNYFRYLLRKSKYLQEKYRQNKESTPNGTPDSF